MNYVLNQYVILKSCKLTKVKLTKLKNVRGLCVIIWKLLQNKAQDNTP